MKFASATFDALWLGKVRQARTMSEEERVLAGPRLFAGVCERMKADATLAWEDDEAG